MYNQPQNLYKRVAKKKFVCFQSLLKLHNKSTYGASGFCENYTTKTPLYIYYIISKTANAACIILAGCYTVSVLNRVRATKERRTEHKRMNRTQCAGRSRWQYCRRWRKGITPGEKFKCKGDEQIEICFQVLYCGRGYYGGLPAIRAHKVKRMPRPCVARFQKVYDYQQLLSINKEC